MHACVLDKMAVRVRLKECQVQNPIVEEISVQTYRRVAYFKHEEKYNNLQVIKKHEREKYKILILFSYFFLSSPILFRF